MATRKDYLFKTVGRRLLLVLDPDTLEEVGRFELPERFTMADAEKVKDAMLAEIKRREVKPS
jgi:hypothetical protein